MQNTVTISPDIIRDVARITALATPGVISLVENDGRWRSRATSGIEAVLNNGYAYIKLNVIGHTGHSLIALASQIRNNIAEAVNEVTDVTVASVDITFEDVRPH